MSAQRRQRPPPGPLAVAAAGAAFAVGVVAVLEVASLALSGPRGALRTWGPIVTVLSAGVIVAVGIPGATLAEAAGRRATSRAQATAAGYLVMAVMAGALLWLLWRALVDPRAAPGDLAREFLVLGLGAAAMWAGARVAERYSPVLLFGFAGTCLAALAVVTATLLRG